MRCHCGQPLHYTSKAVKALVDELVARKGEFVKVTYRGKSWWISRHYIALHGLVGRLIPKLGFTRADSGQA